VATKGGRLGEILDADGTIKKPIKADHNDKKKRITLRRLHTIFFGARFPHSTACVPASRSAGV